MKKSILAVITALLISSLFISCKRGTCDVCGEEKVVQTVEILGQKAELCSSCKKEAKATEKALKALEGLEF